MHLTYNDIERQLAAALPEIHPVLEHYWRVEGAEGSDSGPYVCYECVLQPYVDLLLSIAPSPKRDRLLQRAFEWIETMHRCKDSEVRTLASIVFFESRPRSWYQAAAPFLGPTSAKEIEHFIQSPREKRLQQWFESEPADAAARGIIDLYGVRPLVANLLSSEGIVVDRLPGQTQLLQA